MLPKIRFSKTEIIHKGTNSARLGVYDPKTNTLDTCTHYGWKTTIAAFVHEIVHWFQWFFICRQNVEMWDNEVIDEEQEEQAKRIEEFVYWTILRGKENEVYYKE